MSFASTATIVFDPFAQIRIVCESCDQNSSMSHSGVPVIGYGVGNWIEDIDNLSKTISLKGPILVTDQGVGYTFTIGSQTYSDLFNWIVRSRGVPESGYRAYTIKNVSMNIQNKATITIDLQCNTPLILDTWNITKPTFQIYEGHVQIIDPNDSGNNQEYTAAYVKDNKAARILRNYDLTIAELINNYVNTPVVYSRFVESLNIKYSVNWKDVKTMPTIYHSPSGEKYREDTLYKTPNSTVPDDGPFIIQKVIDNITVQLDIVAYWEEAYYNGQTPDDFDRDVGTMKAGHAPVHVLRREAGTEKWPLTSYLDPSMNLTAIFVNNLNTPASFMHWRLVNKNVMGKSDNLLKVATTWQGIIRTNGAL